MYLQDTYMRLCVDKIEKHKKTSKLLFVYGAALNGDKNLGAELSRLWKGGA